MRILLLNPPGEKIYTRDYYCSKVSKSDYIYQPTDLLILSGILAQRHEISVLDAIAQSFSKEKCADLILKGNFDAIVFLSGSISWLEDAIFLKNLKAQQDFLAIGTGDILLDEYQDLMAVNNWLDAIMLDFTTSDILTYLDKNYEQVKNMVFRLGSQIIDKSAPRDFQREFEIPIPRHELFPNKKYHYPFARRSPFALVLTDYGCPFQCNFCVMNQIGFKYRKLENVFSELKHIKKLGFKDIYFNDQTFGARRDRLQALCDFLISQNLGFGWVCWSRVDVVDEAALSLMKKAGCHTILFGVETRNNQILKNTNKGFSSEQVKKTFELCHKIGIRTLGTFLFGLPGEDRESCLDTINFAKEIKADFASFNILVPRLNTKVRAEAIERGWVNKSLKIMDQSGSFAVMGNDKMSAQEIENLRKKAIRDFYFRPSYILKRLFGIRTLYELKLLIINGWSLMINLVGK